MEGLLDQLQEALEAAALAEVAKAMEKLPHNLELVAMEQLTWVVVVVVALIFRHQL